VKLTTHLHLVRRSRTRGAILPLPQYAFVAWCSVKAQGQLYLHLTSVLLGCECFQESNPECQFSFDSKPDAQLSVSCKILLHVGCQYRSPHTKAVLYFDDLSDACGMRVVKQPCYSYFRTTIIKFVYALPPTTSCYLSAPPSPPVVRGLGEERAMIAQ
jgi:hypothetical protein